ncbi:MAG: hypothetical protein D6775_10100 [Caldilineae bacterium]|nr:MAG: hypothetical protein D6775_10100 [Caldilineae bacterium]
MEILENRDTWYETFRNNWLAHYLETGQVDWTRYNRPRNTRAPAGPGVDLSKSKLILISTAGGYLRDRQEPFDAENDLGDYTLRTFPSSTSFSEIAFAHTHYDHAAVDRDPQVLLPLRHLEDMQREGIIGELASSVISLMGYQPDVTRVLDEAIPAVVEAVKREEAQAALLVPA